MRGFILYQGPSVLDGAPIVAVATLETSNKKTGNMIQTWIIRSDQHPVEASKAGADISVCGNCPHKHNSGGACYVNIGQAPASVYKAYKRGVYPVFDPALHSKYLMGRKIRLGAYGDPAAIPARIWSSVVALCDGHTGYTHQARHPRFQPDILEFCMVSADSPKQAKKMHLEGARTFRVAMADDQALPGEVECLSDTKGISCLDCGLCDGGKGKKSVFIRVHGSRKSNFKTARVDLIPLVAEA